MYPTGAGDVSAKYFDYRDLYNAIERAQSKVQLRKGAVGAKATALSSSGVLLIWRWRATHEQALTISCVNAGELLAGASGTRGVLNALRLGLREHAARFIDLFRDWDTYAASEARVHCPLEEPFLKTHFQRVRDGSGTISLQEFSQALQRLGMKAAPKEIEIIFRDFDKDGSGSVGLISDASRSHGHNHMHTFKCNVANTDNTALHALSCTHTGSVSFIELKHSLRAAVAIFSPDQEESDRSTGKAPRNSARSAKGGNAPKARPSSPKSKKAKPSVEAVFKKYDSDRSGGLAKREIRNAVRELGVEVDTKGMRDTMLKFDSGQVMQHACQHVGFFHTFIRDITIRHFIH